MDTPGCIPPQHRTARSRPVGHQEEPWVVGVVEDVPEAKPKEKLGSTSFQGGSSLVRAPNRTGRLLCLFSRWPIVHPIGQSTRPTPATGRTRRPNLVHQEREFGGNEPHLAVSSPAVRPPRTHPFQGRQPRWGPWSAGLPLSPAYPRLEIGTDGGVWTIHWIAPRS